MSAESANLAASQFLRAIRGARSQIALARRLGYRANPITDWENGRRYPTAAEALRACARTGVDVAGAFARFHAAAPPATTDRAAVAAWLEQARGSTPIAALAARSGLSRFSIARFLHGQAQPRLPDFFRLVDAITGRLPDLVAQLCAIEQVPELHARFVTAAAAKSLAFEQPWTEAVLRLLETTAYSSHVGNDREFIAQCLGISVDEAADCLQRLTEAGIVHRESGRHHVRGNLTVETRSDPEAAGKLFAHWAQVAVDRQRHQHAHDLFAYNVLSISKQDLARVRELLRSTYREVRSIVAASEPSETAALLNLHLVQWEQGEPKSPDTP